MEVLLNMKKLLLDLFLQDLKCSWRPTWKYRPSVVEVIVRKHCKGSNTWKCCFREPSNITSGGPTEGGKYYT